jgi:hypothetical protein
VQMKEIGTANFVCNIPTDLEISKSLVNKQGKNAVPLLSWFLLQTLTGPQPARALCAFYANQGWIIVFITARHASLFPSQVALPCWISGYNMNICHIVTLHSTWLAQKIFLDLVIKEPFCKDYNLQNSPAGNSFQLNPLRSSDYVAPRLAFEFIYLCEFVDLAAKSDFFPKQL